MKKIRSIQFKVFICLFISFMVVFGYVVKNKYTEYKNELYYSNYEENDSNEYVEYAKYLAEQEFISLKDEKNILSKLPKSYESALCLLDSKGNLLQQYGLNENDCYLYASRLNHVDEYSKGMMEYYYIDVSQFSKKQIKELKNNISSCQNISGINIYFSGQIEELNNFQMSSKSAETVKNRYFYVKPTYLKYNKDIFGVKQDSTVEVSLDVFYNKGKITVNNAIPSYSLDGILSVKQSNELIQKAMKTQFSGAIISGMSESESSLDDKLSKYKDKDVIKKSIQNNSLMDANFKMINQSNSYSCYIVRFNQPELSNQVSPGYLVVFYDFSNVGIRSVYQWLFSENITLFIGGILFVLLFSLFISYMTTKRIKQIDQATLEISNNHFDVVLNTKGYDELSSLSSHINVMSSNLKRNIDALNLEIDQVKKMEQLRKEFIAQFTHEIKTPLAIINGNIDLLENVDDEIKKEKYIEVINKEIAHINDLILQMLDLSRLEAKAITLDKQKIDLRELTEDIIDDYEQLFMNKKLKIEIQGENVNLFGDRKRIAMVIQNYLSNAIKHADYESTIIIKITQGEFSVENKGKQIEKNRMDTIWESFVSDDQKGTGLGLAIVRNILELHEMSYGVHNLEDGVEFYFRW